MLSVGTQPQRARSSTRTPVDHAPPRPLVADTTESPAAAAPASQAPEGRPHRLSARPPPTADGDVKLPRTFSFVSSTDALQGRRGTMEDSHISIDDLARYYPDLFAPFQQRALPNALYGIYDGHVGKRASVFVSDTLHDRICRDPAFPATSRLSLLLPPSPEHSGDDAGDDRLSGTGDGPEDQRGAAVEEVTDGVCRAMEAGFLQTDREFIENAVREENRWKDGSTAVVALLLGSHVFVANVGDSEALLGKREYNWGTGEWEESFEVLTVIHKPTMPTERARIEKEGGFIVGGRVGGLAVSRSFGDRNMKLPIEEDGFWHGVLVDPHPHVMHRQLSPATDSFLLLGCDGVWENWTHKESVEFVFEKLDEGLAVDELTEAITRRAHVQGSQDNISATLLLFRWV